jgi:hypothetical protein
MKERMWRKGGCKETGGGEKRMEKVTRRERKKTPHTVLMYSSFGRFSNREVGCTRNGEVSGLKCEERRECGEMGSVKKEGDSVKKGKV